MEIFNFSKEFSEIKLGKGINFIDNRGFLKKTVYGKNLSNLMPTISEVITTTSKKDVIRGIHFQNPPHAVKKFITCVYGEIEDVFIDLRKDSEYYGKVGSFILNESDIHSILIPEGFGHGYKVKSDVAIVNYIQSGSFNSKYDSSINPTSIEFNWNIKNPIISKKDLNAISFKNFDSLFKK